MLITAEEQCFQTLVRSSFISVWNRTVTVTLLLITEWVRNRRSHVANSGIATSSFKK